MKWLQTLKGPFATRPAASREADLTDSSSERLEGRSLRASGSERLEGSATSVYAAAALLLGHPTQELLERLPQIAQSVRAAGAYAPFAPLLEHLGITALIDLQSEYAQEFDNSRRHALHLTYWIDGDTRRRGESLLRYKHAYRESGLWVDLAGELPDYLPMVLEFAVHDPERGGDLLSSSRPALELLRLALRDDGLPHEGVVAAVCATLPGESPADRLSIARMSGWQPPSETVGLAGAPAPYSMTAAGMPHGARLPLFDARDAQEL